MAGASEIKAGHAFVSIGTKDSAFEAGLKKAEKRLKSFGTMLAGIGGGLMAGGGVLAAPLIGFIKSFTDTGTQLQLLHERLGMSVEDLSALEGMAREVGLPLEDLANDIFKFQVALGSGKAAKALTDIGVAAADLNGKTTAEQLALIADAFENIHDQGVKAAAVRALFGRGGAPLLPLLNEGGDAMRARQGIFTSEDAKLAHEFHVNLLQIERAAKSAAMAIGGSLVKSIMEYIDPIKAGVRFVAEFVKRNREVAGIVGAVALGLTLAGAALVAFGTAAWAAGAAIGAIVGLVGFLTSWPVLILAAVAAVVAFGTNWTALGERFKESWGSIVNALRAGELEAAFKVICSTLKVEWLKVMMYWGEQWDKFKAKTVGSKDRPIFSDLRKGLELMGADLESWLDSKMDGAPRDRKRHNEIIREAGDAWGKNRDDKAAELIKLQKELADAEKAQANAILNANKVKVEVAKKVEKAGSMAAGGMGLGDSTKGTFSPYAIAQALAVGDKIEERIAIAGEKVADNTDKMVDLLENMDGLVFA